MKKPITILLLVLISFVLIGQESELSDYEKYRMAQEAEKFNEPDTNKTDTVYIVVEKEREPVVINNNYYNDYPDYRLRLTFGYVYRPYYNPWYYDNWYYGYNYPYYTHYYPYNRYYYDWYRPRYYYSHHRHYSPKPNRGYHVSSSLGTTRYRYSGGKTYRSGTMTSSSKPKTITTRKVVTPKNTRTYNPKYTKPRTSSQTKYNKPVRSTYGGSHGRSSSSTRVSTSTRTYNNTKSSSYRAPSRAPSKSYSRSTTPSRSSSNYSRSSSSYNRGGATRSTPSRSSGSVRTGSTRRK